MKLSKDNKEDQYYYLVYDNRKMTFRPKWRVKGAALCTAENFARAGFIYIGNRSHPDLVQCFACKKELDGWESDDDPWAEHARRGAECPFVIAHSDENGVFVETLTREKYTRLLFALCIQQNINKAEEIVDALENKLNTIV